MKLSKKFFKGTDYPENGYKGNRIDIFFFKSLISETNKEVIS